MGNRSSSGTNRREFLGGLASAGALACLAPGLAWAQTVSAPAKGEVPAFAFKYRTVSVRHLPELKSWLDQLDRKGQLSTHPTYRKYIGSFKFAVPENLPAARSLIVLASPLRVAAVTFKLDGRSYDLLIPSGYVDDGVPPQAYVEQITARILKDPARKLEPAKLPLKSLAVRCGLARYGKNNVTFIDGWGSFFALAAFYTEEELKDHWGPLKLLRLCKGCSICIEACPTKCFTEDKFVIDAGKCLALYNELTEPFPSWLDPKVHHTLVGCLKCQATCPANLEGMKNIEHIAELTEAETKFLFSDGKDEVLHKSIIAKLKRFPYAVDFPYFSRNFRLAWANRERA